MSHVARAGSEFLLKRKKFLSFILNFSCAIFGHKILNFLILVSYGDHDFVDSHRVVTRLV